MISFVIGCTVDADGFPVVFIAIDEFGTKGE